MIEILRARRLPTLFGLALGLTACGGDNNGTTTPPPADALARLVPAEARLSRGQQARFAVIGIPAAARQSDPLVVEVLGWSIADPVIATVAAQADGSALVTARADGVTTLTARTANGSLESTLRVGAESLTAETLAGLAAALTDAIRRGEVTAASPTLPRAVALPDNVVQELAAEVGLPARMIAIFLNPMVFNSQPVTVSQADLSIGESFESSRATTHDGTLELGVRLLFRRLENAGCDMTAFYDALDHTRLHQEGGTADGIRPRSGVPAVTFLPGPTWYNGSLVVIHDGNAHTVYDDDTADAVRNGRLLADGKLTEAGSTVIHELMHIILWRLDRGDLDDDGDVWLGRLEALMRAKFDLALTDAAGEPDAGALERFNNAYADFTGEAIGLQLLDIFGQRSQPAAPNLTTPREVGIGQTFTIQVLLQGATFRPNELVYLDLSGAVASPGARAVRTDAQGRIMLTVQAGDSEGEIRVRTSFRNDERNAEIAVVNPANPSAYVVLDHRLDSELGSYLPGQVIFLSRIENGRIGLATEPNCDHDHLHGQGGGIYIDSLGPFPDPDPSGCGYGQVHHRPGG